jgi:hypothetical protein
LYALDGELDVPPGADGDALEAAILDRRFGGAELTGTYER